MDLLATVDELKVPNIVVLLASYNGIAFIETQIDTILTQLNVNVTIYVSDDFSTDGTWEWLQNYRSEKIKLLPHTERFGSAGANFLRLISDVPVEKFDYVAFCDQDDIWFSDKLICAVENIKKYNCNAYSSNVTAFWADGKEALINKAQPQKMWDYYFEAAGPGCTYVLQSHIVMQLAQTIAKNVTLAKKIELHDWLIYAWVRENNYQWYIDPVPGMRYRQHANNVVGVNNGITAAQSRFNKIRNGWYSGQILLIASVINAEIGSPICWIKNPTWGNKFKLIWNYSSCRRRFRDRIAFLIYIVILSF